MIGVKHFCFAVALAVLAAGLGGVFDVYIMRLVRDLGRSKARSRLLSGQENAMMIFIGQEQELDDSHFGDPWDDQGMVALSQEELAEYDGGPDGSGPLYLSIKGRIYDVSEGRHFYGKGRSYHHFVGRDATRAFATGCTAEACLISSLEGLSESALREAQRWVEFFEFHDKYRLVGALKQDPVDVVLDLALAEEALLEQILKDGETAQVMFEKGKMGYAQQDFDKAYALWRAALIRLLSQSTEQSLSLRSDIYLHLAALHQKRHEYQQAIEYYDEALDVVVEEKSSLAATIYADKAAALYHQGHVDQAIENFRTALTVYEQLAIADIAPEDLDEDKKKTQIGHANVLFNLATLTQDTNLLKQILRLYANQEHVAFIVSRASNALNS